MEKEFDDIAQGLTEWTKMIQDFYTPFHKDVENTMENAERANTNRDLGIDPVSGKQPLYSADGQLVLAANGEIYNHRELRKQLKSEYEFQT